MALIVARNKCRYRFAVRFVSFFESEIAAALHNALSRYKQRNRRIQTVGFVGDNVRVDISVERSDPFEFQLSDHLQFFAVIHRQLKLFLFGEFQHFFTQNFFRFFEIAV